ncbi:MAG: peptidoglycan-binding protein [Candidatus Eisenbacteria bacterium]
MVLTIRVPEPSVTQGTLEIQTAKGTTSVNMTRGTAGWECPRRFLLMYGEDGDLQGAAFEGIELLDVTKSGDIPFEQLIKCRVQGHERELGVVDFLIKDADGKFRTARHGVFKGRKPTFKLVAPRIGPNFLEVFLDDADEDTMDEIEITKLVKPEGAVTAKSDFQEAVAKDSPDVKVGLGEKQPRRRIFDAPPAGGDLATFMLGENRVRIEDSRNGLVYFQGNFLLYEKPDETIPLGAAVEEMEIELDGDRLNVGKGVLTLELDSGLKDYDFARYLYGVRLRPRGFLREAGYFQAGTFTKMEGAELTRLIDRIRGFNDPGVISVGFDVRMVPDAISSMALERLPGAFRDVSAPEFNPGAGIFANAQPHFHHHFAIHTFAAHRLIDKILFPDLDPPTFTLVGGNFDLDKTFLLPTGKDEIRRIIAARRDHPDRKLAIFGHTDATGSDAFNNELSRRRGRTCFALLTRDVDEWMTRLDGSGISNERAWGTREVQHMLTVTGQYTATVDGIKGDKTRQAVKDFQNSKGLTPSGNDDAATRRELVGAYMDDMTGGALAAGDFHADIGGGPAVFGCGEAFLLVTTEAANPQNRRVVIVLRRTPIDPVDAILVGPAVPFNDWLAQEAVEDAPAPDFVVGCGDTGFGLSDDFRGDHLNEPNRLFIKGKRITRPTDVNSAAAANTIIFDSGDLRTISDAQAGRIFHGTAVMTSMAGDGAGDDVGGGGERTAQQVVLGTGKDVRFRPIRSATDFASSLRKFEVLAADPEIKIVSSSLLQQNAQGLPAGLFAQSRTRIKNFIDGGRIYFVAAANTNPVNPNLNAQRDVFRTEGGQLAPQRTQTRASFSGANAFQGKICVVGATNHVTRAGEPELPSSFTYLGAEVSIACPGTDIRVVSPLVPPAGGVLAGGEQLVNGVRIQPINGTSFSTPMTAGIAGEMLLVNPALKQAANIGRTIELLEATADDIPSLAAAPTATPTGAPGVTINEQGIFLPGQPNADTQLTAADLAGFRRVHFWKAILAAANDGIPAEAKLANGSAATTLFTQLTTRDHAATVFYGFEIRINLLGANVWLKRADGSQVQFQDTGASLPNGRTSGSAWRLAQDFRVPATNPNAGLRGFTIPPLPIGAANRFMCQFSIKREELDTFSELRLYIPEIDPTTPLANDPPPLLALPIAQIARMRDPRAITAAERSGNPALDQIATHVEEFNSFVFHVSVVPQPVAAFQFVHLGALAVGEETFVRLFAVDKFGNMKTDFNGPVNVFHTGTAGAAGPLPAGVFINDAPVTAAVPIAIANGVARFKLVNQSAGTFRLTASDGGGRTERAPADIKVAVPGPLGSFRVDILRDDGAEPGTNPPRVDDKLRVGVTPLDAEGRTKADYRGTIELKVIEGTEGYDASPGDKPEKGGVQVADAIMDPFDAARLRHTFVAGDNGHFRFDVFNYTAGPLQLGVNDGDASGQSRKLETRASALTQFELEVPTSATLGSPITLVVTCKDRFENVITDIDDRVKVTVIAGTAGAVAANGTKSGVHIGETSAAADDFHEMEQADRGVCRFRVTPYTAENIQLRVAVDGGVQADTPVIAVPAAGALASLGLEVFASQMSGVRFRVKVKALDANGRVITTFVGTVSAALAAGTAFVAAGPSGVQIHAASHVYAAPDNGEFQFDVTGFTAENVQLRYSSGGISATTPNVAVQ